MEEEIDIHQFIANVEMAGCVALESETFEGENITTLLSRNGKRRVFIITTDGSVTKDIAIDYLFDLELADMVDAFFPKS